MVTADSRMDCESHVYRTGNIKDLIIVEETGIAKGIRRMIAFTGTEAREANHLAQEAEDGLAQLQKLKGKEKATAAKGFLVVRIGSITTVKGSYTSIGSRSILKTYRKLGRVR